MRRVVQQVLATRRAPVERDDMVSWGIVGLMDAIRKYDPEKGATFATYAQYRIRGAVLDQLRSSDWAPRSVRAKANIIESTSRELEGELGRPPSGEELAGRLGLSDSDYHRFRATAAGTSLISLEDVHGSTEGEAFARWLDDECVEPLQALLSHEQVSVVSDGLKCLPERERLAMRLYYGDYLSMKDVGDVLGVSESRVSQLHSRAIGRLKRYVEQRLETGSPGEVPTTGTLPRAAADVPAPDAAVPLRRSASS